MNKDEYILVGKIIGAHGIKGHVKLKSFTNHPEDIFDYSQHFTSSGEPLKLKLIIPDRMVICLNGAQDRNKAETQIGTEIYIKKTDLKEPAEGEYYHSDLIGLDIIDESGTKHGEIMAVHNFGAGEILEYKLDTGKTEMISFTSNFVHEVNLEQGFVKVTLPEFG